MDLNEDGLPRIDLVTISFVVLRYRFACLRRRLHTHALLHKNLFTLHLKITLHILDPCVQLNMATFREHVVALLEDPSQNRPHFRTVGTTVYAHVVDLNGDAITSGQPLPTIHRSASGHLIIPNHPAHSCEKCRPRPELGSSTALDILRLSLRGGTNAFFHSSEEIVKINDGPAKKPVIVEELSTWSMKMRGVDKTHACCNASLLKRRGCLVVNVVRRKSQVGILERGGDEG